LPIYPTAPFLGGQPDQIHNGIYPEGVDGPGTPLRQYGTDATLCEALNTLNVTVPQQQRILSVLRSATHESFPVDISEDVARQFGWRPAI
jgi:hypothetical protein